MGFPTCFFICLFVCCVCFFSPFITYFVAQEQSGSLSNDNLENGEGEQTPILRAGYTEAPKEGAVYPGLLSCSDRQASSFRRREYLAHSHSTNPHVALCGPPETLRFSQLDLQSTFGPSS